MQDIKLKIKNYPALAAAVFLMLAVPVSLSAYKTSGTSIQDAKASSIRAVGVNMPGLLVMEEKQAAETIKSLEGIGVKYIRFLVSFSGAGANSFQPEPGVYNNEMFEKMDRIAALAGKSGMKMIIALGDGSAEYGGKKAYLDWSGGSNPDIFFKDRISMNLFKKFIKQVVTRVNTSNKETYASDSAIFSWDLCNSASNENDPDGSVMYAWASEMAAYVRSMDKTHLVTINLEMNNFENSKINNYDMALLPGIDYVTCTDDGRGNLNSTVQAYIMNSGKPVAAIAAGRDEVQGESLKKAVEAGAFMVLAGINSPDEKSMQALAGLLSALKNQASALKSIQVSDSVSSINTDSAVIKVSVPPKAAVTIAYGTAEPVKTMVEGSGSINITGLNPGTKYYYRVKAGLDGTGYVSPVKSFTTKQLVRLKALPFQMSDNFIKAKGTSFFDGNRKYRFFGANNYYIRHKVATDKKLVDEIFRQAAAAGIKVMRIGSNGEAENMDAIDQKDINRFFRIGPDYFNEAAYREYDYVMDSAARHGIRIIVHFTDYWEYYGGVAVYAKWAGFSNKDMFFTEEKCKEYFRQTVDSFINRKNTVNGRLYKNDPTIFAYDLMNEPENRSDITAKSLAAWIDEMAAYIKSKDKNHMVTTGMVGHMLKEDGTHYSGSDFTLCQQSKDIDFATFHIYPASEYTNFSPSTTAWMLENYIKIGHEKLGKPVVMEEYGIPNNNPDYPKAKWIREMTETFFKAGGDGVNYWFFIDPSYNYGDGNEVNYTQTEYMNIFIKTANELNKNGY